MAKWNAAVWTSAGMRNKLKYAPHVRASWGVEGAGSNESGALLDVEHLCTLRCRILLGLYQCLATVPSNFDVTAPEGLEFLIDWIELPNLIGIQARCAAELESAPTS